MCSLQLKNLFEDGSCIGAKRNLCNKKLANVFQDIGVL